MRDRWTCSLGALSAVVLSLSALGAPIRAQALFDRLSKDHVQRFEDRLFRPVLGDFDGDGDVDVMDADRLVVNFLGRLVHAPALPGVRGAFGAHDFDGDGRDDVFEVESGGADTAGISLNRLPFGFVRQALPFLPRARRVADHAVGDLDGDGDLDLLITFSTVREPVFQLVNDGNGRFTDATSIRMPPAGAWVDALRVTDADGDGDLDVLVIDRQASGLALMTNQGGGVMSAPTPLGIGAGAIFDVVDLDADGDEDVITAGPTVLLNQGGAYAVSPIALLPVNPYVTAVRSGDLDGDGDVDLWVESNEAERATWFENRTPGAPFVDRIADVPIVRRAVDQVVLRDVDGDGILDVISLGDRIEVLRGQPGGRFVDLTPEPAVGLAYGDYDGDGDTDRLIWTGFFRLALAANDGAGGSTERLVSLGWTATAIHGQADVDGDGDIDLLARGPWPSNGGAILQNDGTGSFRPIPSSLPATVDSVVWSMFGDLDGDGDLDLVLHCSPSNRPRELLVLRNDGSGVFAPEPAWQLPALNGRLLVGVLLDAEPDGDLDMVVGDDDPILHVNDGTGVMTAVPGAIPGRFAASGSRPSELSSADVDGDGYSDLFAAHTRETNPFGAPEDAALYMNNGDGTFRARDVFAESGEWIRGVLVDVDADGDPDLVSNREEIVAGVREYTVEIRVNDGRGTLASAGIEFGAVDWLAQGRFVDVDDDGDVDFLGGLRWMGQITNLTRQLHSRLVPQVGGMLELEVPNPKPRSLRTAAFLIAPVLLPRPRQVLDFGLLIVDPTTAIVESRFSRFYDEPVKLSVPVPSSTALVGVDVFAQALVDVPSAPRLTNAIRETIVR